MLHSSRTPKLSVLFNEYQLSCFNRPAQHRDTNSPEDAALSQHGVESLCRAAELQLTPSARSAVLFKRQSKDSEFIIITGAIIIIIAPYRPDAASTCVNEQQSLERCYKQIRRDLQIYFTFNILFSKPNLPFAYIFGRCGVV